MIAIGNTIANGGIESKDNLFFAVPVIVAPLLLSARWALFSTLAVAIELSVFAWLGWAGIRIPRLLPGVPLGVWFLGLLILWLIYRAITLSVEGWNQALELAHQELEERRRAEVERDNLKKRLYQAQKMQSLGRMAGGVAHDFNNLLMVITCELDLMKELHPDDGKLAKNVVRVEDALQSARRMTRSLLDFSKNRELRLERLEMDLLIREALPVLYGFLGNQVKLVTDLQAAGVAVMADKTGLEQILHNLVVNAREAMTQDGLLVIKTEEYVKETDQMGMGAGRYLLLTVRDNGCGMSRVVKERMFEPFFTTKEKGTGLGLATVFGVVKQLGGVLEVDSEPGKGTEFRIFLPRV